MHFATTLIAVTDMERSLRFYKELFDQEVTVDLGWNKTLTCGLTLQLNFDKIADFDPAAMHFRNHTMELYFESEHFDEWLARLDAHPEVERLHEVRQFPWLQRGIHIYDPDGHLLEVSESMYSVGCKLFRQGKSIEETSILTEHPLQVVRQWYEKYTQEGKTI